MPLDRRLIISDAKLVDYLLNLVHPDGGPKARFLIGHGFRADNPAALAEALILHARTNWPGRKVQIGAESRFVIDGPLRTPAGTVGKFRSVWQGFGAESDARLITAYPID